MIRGCGSKKSYRQKWCLRYAESSGGLVNFCRLNTILELMNGRTLGNVTMINKIPSHIFIVGNSRSGTTMLGRVLGNHSKVHTFGELHFFEHQVDAVTVEGGYSWPKEQRIELIERLLTSARDGFFCPVCPGQYESIAEHILSTADEDTPVAAYDAFLRMEAERHGKQIPLEQTPRYLFFVKEIMDCFPNARIINIVRDPRDVLLSQKNKWRRRHLGAKNIPCKEAFRSWVNYHPYTISRLWVSAVRTANRYSDHPWFISIRFEDLLQNPEVMVKKLCDFAGINFEGAMLEVPQIGSSTGIDKPEIKGINSDRINAWRNGGLSQAELAVCQSTTAKEMSLLGYKPEAVMITMLQRLVIMGGFGLKIFAALLLNLDRSKNFVDTLRRRLTG